MNNLLYLFLCVYVYIFIHIHLNVYMCKFAAKDYVGLVVREGNPMSKLGDAEQPMSSP